MATRPDGGTEKSVPVPFSRTLGRMIKTLWRPELKIWRVRMIFAFSVTLLAKVFEVASPVFLGEAINALSNGNVNSAGVSFVGMIVAFGIARFMGNAIPQGRDAFFVRVTQSMNRVIAREAFLHAQRQSLHFHLTRRAGALNRVIERGSGAMEFLLRFLVFNIGPTFVALGLAAGVITWRYGMMPAVIAVATVVLYVVFTVRVTEWRNRLRRDMNIADTELKAITMDTFANFETVKAFASEEREAERFNSSFGNFMSHYIRSMKSMYAMNAGQEFIMSGGLLAVALIAGSAVARGQLQVGDVTAIILMMANIYRPLNILGFAWREINQSSVDVENLYDLMAQTPDVRDDEDAQDLNVSGGEISFENVAFAYQGRDRSLDDVSFTVPAGSFLGVVGPSGAGKSTLVKLMFRFYDPARGCVRIDGQDIAKVRQNSLRDALGLVPQDVTLFNDTLRMNLAYARPDADDALILEAAQKAQLGAFIESLPQGLETVVGERGLKLSGGERQRVGLARAILGDPTILVLDEATSSLDSTTEEDVQIALREAARGRTTVAIAHRLSTIVEADRIIVLEDGKIAESGTHQSLIAKQGVYAALWQKQVRQSKQSA